MEIQVRTRCILCLSENLNEVFCLEPTPIANMLPKNLSEARELQGIRVPLTLLSCGNCEHVQLREIVPSNTLFDDYPYVSVSNATMKRRLASLCNWITKEAKLNENESVLEIGSNDGALLKEFQNKGNRVLGVDPADKVALKAEEMGIKTIVDFFSSNLTDLVFQELGIPKIIIANNVLAHTNDLRDILNGISILMNEDSHLFVEFSYLLDVLERNLVDTVYHEHTSYHHILPLHKLVQEYGLKIVQATRFGAHGGSLRLQIVKQESQVEVEKDFQNLLNLEKSMNLSHLNNHVWESFRSQVRSLANQLKNILKEEHAIGGMHPLGYGVSAKFSSLYYGLGLDEFAFADFYDDNPLKIGRFAPGTLKQILPAKDLNPKINQSIFLFAWNYSEEVLVRIKRINQSAKIIVPLPKTKVVY